MRDNWLSNRIFLNYDDILDHRCDAWNKLRDQPWRVISIGLRVKSLPIATLFRFQSRPPRGVRKTRGMSAQTINDENAPAPSRRREGVARPKGR